MPVNAGNASEATPVTDLFTPPSEAHLPLRTCQDFSCPGSLIGRFCGFTSSSTVYKNVNTCKISCQPNCPRPEFPPTGWIPETGKKITPPGRRGVLYFSYNRLGQDYGCESVENSVKLIDSDFHGPNAPIQCFLKAIKKEVDAITLDGISLVSGKSLSISFDIKLGFHRNYVGIRGRNSPG